MDSKPIGLAVVGSGRIGSLRSQLAVAHPAVSYIAGLFDKILNDKEQ